MGIPIPGFDIESDRVPRSNICLAVNCQCPECRHRHIIRLGSAIRQTRRQELQDLVQAAAAAENYIIPGITGAAANVIPSMGYIDTRLPDYRYRHSSSHSDAVNMRDYHGPTNLTTNNSRSGSDFSQSSASELYTPSGLNVNNISIVGKGGE
ncbi:hypothetical protein FBU30_007857 [Linnemannia zychae]|nr:hypothetical protein FBU30_007857 [Linnemannia zychae]